MQCHSFSSCNGRGTLIIYEYSILVGLDTIISCIFFKSCKATTYRLDQQAEAACSASLSLIPQQREQLLQCLLAGFSDSCSFKNSLSLSLTTLKEESSAESDLAKRVPPFFPAFAAALFTSSIPSMIARGCRAVYIFLMMHPVLVHQEALKALGIVPFAKKNSVIIIAVKGPSTHFRLTNCSSVNSMIVDGCISLENLLIFARNLDVFSNETKSRTLLKVNRKKVDHVITQSANVVLGSNMGDKTHTYKEAIYQELGQSFQTCYLENAIKCRSPTTFVFNRTYDFVALFIKSSYEMKVEQTKVNLGYEIKMS
ncbi:hypothetical protein SADUNF_Sadunf11G0083300 [Salix dunnii]|uniref:Uncharacterized protein n=1 Tax=Salix dunnii TaxID=1413687 RepID=A0A835JQL1_9ROSI|nr:hypothetical protein SADUNF_Sadunf11G0083300 [Salix dunnii]